MQTENSLNPYGRIYRLTDTTNGKMYHGQTTEENIERRWGAYRRLQCKGQIKLYNALKAHGPENFLFEVIDTTPQDQPQLDEMEIKYIAKFDSMNNGYNCDEGGGKKSEETKRRLSESKSGSKNPQFGKRGDKSHNFGKKLSEETKYKISESRKGIKNPNFGKCGKLSNRFGKIMSDEVRQRISDSLKGRNVRREKCERVANLSLGSGRSR